MWNLVCKRPFFRKLGPPFGKQGPPFEKQGPPFRKPGVLFFITKKYILSKLKTEKNFKEYFIKKGRERKE